MLPVPISKKIATPARIEKKMLQKVVRLNRFIERSVYPVAHSSGKATAYDCRRREKQLSRQKEHDPSEATGFVSYWVSFLLDE
jgi:hypothetical protein